MLGYLCLAAGALAHTRDLERRVYVQPEPGGTVSMVVMIRVPRRLAALVSLGSTSAFVDEALTDLSLEADGYPAECSETRRFPSFDLLAADEPFEVAVLFECASARTWRLLVGARMPSAVGFSRAAAGFVAAPATDLDTMGREIRELEWITL